jgi:hypothetical protein
MVRPPLFLPLWIAAVLGAVATGATASPARPEAVSPGAAERVVALLNGCPTYSWTLVPGAQGFELAVHRAEKDSTAEPAAPTLRVEVPATSAWTPSLEECLAPGQYGWVVRAKTAQGWTEWSEPRLFEVRERAEEPKSTPKKREISAQNLAGPRPWPEAAGEPASAVPVAPPGRAGAGPSALTGLSTYEPSDCVVGDEIFSDVAASNPLCGWIQQLYRDGVTNGCGAGRYCPNDPVNRGQLAMFLERALQARGVRQIDAGHDHACAVLETDRVVCWGNNADGEAPATPSPFAFRLVSGGGSHTCGVRSDGKAVCWGDNSSGQAPSGPSGTTYKSVAAGGAHTCGIRSDDSVVCWGDNSLGQAPAGPTATNYAAISAGTGHTCGIRTDDKVLCWGNDANGQAPAGPTATSYQSISAGDKHTCGVRLDGKVVCWGDNNFGQAPAGPTADSFQSIASGGAHTCGLRTDGRVVCWGDNSAGQAPAGPSAARYRSITAGFVHTCGVRLDGGTVECWGLDFQGQLTPPAWM